MNISEHTRILKAYIDRLTIAELETITRAVGKCWHESFNGNQGSQEDADLKLYSAIMDSLGSMQTHDRDSISAVVSKIVNRT